MSVKICCCKWKLKQKHGAFLFPDGDDDDDVAAADEEGGDDKQCHRDQRHVQPPLPLWSKIKINVIHSETPGWRRILRVP